MNDEKATKVKLYTFAEMKDALAQVVADVAANSAHNDDFDEPFHVALTKSGAIADDCRQFVKLLYVEDGGNLTVGEALELNKAAENSMGDPSIQE